MKLDAPPLETVDLMLFRQIKGVHVFRNMLPLTTVEIRCTGTGSVGIADATGKLAIGHEERCVGLGHHQIVEGRFYAKMTQNLRIAAFHWRFAHHHINVAKTQYRCLSDMANRAARTGAFHAEYAIVE